MGDSGTIQFQNRPIKIDGPNELTKGKWRMTLDYGELPYTTLALLTPFKNLLPSTFSGTNGDLMVNRTEQMFVEGLQQVVSKWQDEMQKSREANDPAIRITKQEIVWQEVSIGNEQGETPLVVHAPSQVIIEFEVGSLVVVALVVLGFFGAVVLCHAIFPQATKATFESIGNLFKDAGEGVGAVLEKPIAAIGLPLAIGAAIFVAFWFMGSK